MSVRPRGAGVVGSTLVAVGLLAGVFAFQIAPDTSGSMGPRLFPLLAASALVVLGMLEMLSGSAARPAKAGRARRVLALLALAIAYAFSLGRFGYLIPTGIAAPAAMALFGVRSPLALGLAAILCPVLYHFVFFELLGGFAPRGQWFDLGDVLGG